MVELQPYQREWFERLKAANGRPLVLLVPRIRRVSILGQPKHAWPLKTDTRSSETLTEDIARAATTRSPSACDT